MPLTDYVMMPGQDYQDACDAIRAKTGGTALIKSGDMAGEIESIETGGGDRLTEITVTTGATNFYDSVHFLHNQVVAEIGDVPYIARHISGDIPGYCLVQLMYIPYDYTSLTDNKGGFFQTVRPENISSISTQFFTQHRSERGDSPFTGYTYRLPEGAVYAVVPLPELFVETEVSS